PSGTSAGATTYVDSAASPSTAYSYQVRGTNAVGDGAYSSPATATTPAAPTVPSAPTGLAASAASVSQINLSWSASTGATGYKLERSSDGINYTQIALTSATAYSDTAV